MTRQLGLATWLAAAALTLAACAAGGATPVPATAVPTAETAAPASEPPASEPPASEAPATAATSCEVVEGDAAVTADIAGFAFPAGLSVPAGGAITWTNLDRAPHTVSFDDGSCASGSIAAGASRTVRYDVPGTYPFHCAIHPAMTGSLEVKG
jgi:plastocyanin